MDRRRVLIVDEDRASTMGLELDLDKGDIEIMSAGNRAQAEEMIPDYKPDMVVLGTVVPRGDAYRLHQWLRSSPEFGHRPILVVDAPKEDYGTLGWRRDQAMQMNADEYLYRPMAAGALAKAVEEELKGTVREGEHIYVLGLGRTEVRETIAVAEIE